MMIGIFFESPKFGNIVFSISPRQHSERSSGRSKYPHIEESHTTHPPVELDGALSGHCDDITTNRLFYYAEMLKIDFLFFLFSLFCFLHLKGEK